MKTYAVLLAALIAAPAFGECETVDWGERPEIPSGHKATEEQMLAARAEVVAYVSAGQTYLQCDQPNRFLNNFVVERLERTALKFNRERERFLEQQSAIATN